MNKVQKALRHVREHYPDVVQVFYGVDGRWRYMREDMEAPTFDAPIDIGLLEDAADEVSNTVGFPAAFCVSEIA